MNMERTGGLAVALLAFMKENLFHNLVGPLLISDTLEIGGVPSDDRNSWEKNMGKLYDRTTKAKADRDIMCV